MTTIASLDSSLLAQTQATQVSSSSDTASSPAQAASASQTAPASTTVSIAQVQPVPLTYAIPAPQPVWETNAVDVVSKAMAQNFSSASTVSGRLQGLGQLMLQQLGGGANDFSQSVYLPSTNAVPSATMASAMQSALHSGATNQISLNVTMRDGAQVQITLGEQSNGLAATVTITGGTLSEADRTALLKMAGGFQNAIDGLTSSDQTTVDLAGLVQQFNPNVFASMDLQASVDATGQGAQTVDFHADGTQRSLKTSGPLGSMQISVDMSNPSILGSASQQSQALGNYLQQFAAEGTRGHANAQLISMFSTAFTALNSNYDSTPSYSSSQPTLSSAAHSMLTGLADFSASVTQAGQSPNPMKPGEVDSFNYQVTQNTVEQASNRYNYTVTQTQQSQLQASYHTTLQAGGSLSLGSDQASQNYYYDQINDSAQSQATISYTNGQLTQALLSQSASASTHLQKYVMGDLEEDVTTPGKQSWSENLLDLLGGTQSGAPGSQSVLNNIHSLLYLPDSPSQLANKIG